MCLNRTIALEIEKEHLRRLECDMRSCALEHPESLRVFREGKREKGSLLRVCYLGVFEFVFVCVLCEIFVINNKLLSITGLGIDFGGNCERALTIILI